MYFHLYYNEFNNVTNSIRNPAKNTIILFINVKLIIINIPTYYTIESFRCTFAAHTIGKYSGFI